MKNVDITDRTGRGRNGLMGIKMEGVSEMKRIYQWSSSFRTGSSQNNKDARQWTHLYTHSSQTSNKSQKFNSIVLLCNQ